MVSHQLDRIGELCTDAIVLDRGEVASRGTAAEAIAAYVQSHDATRMVENTGLVMFDSVQFQGPPTVASGHRIALRIDGHTSQALTDTVEPLLVRVRSLRSGNLVFATNSRWFGYKLPSPGPFSVCIELQANLPTGSYMVEVAAEDLTQRKDIASATSVMFKVTDRKTFVGHIQLNAAFQTLSS
jgi:hypothetical protein